MKPKQEAKEIFRIFKKSLPKKIDKIYIKQSSISCVDKILETAQGLLIEYYEEVKKEIENL